MNTPTLDVSAPSGTWIRGRRRLLDLTQAQLARAAQVPQPAISAAEAGRRPLGPAMGGRVARALALRPSVAVERRRAEVRGALARHDLHRPRVFGSVATGEDNADSDLDLLVDPGVGFDPVDLDEIRRELSEMLTVPVDVVPDTDRPSARRFLERIRAEAVAL